MKTYAIIENGLVTNKVIWDGLTPWATPAGQSAIELSEGVTANIGYSYAGGVFAALAVVVPPPAPPAVPQSCTRKQGNLALLELGYLDEVESVIASAPRNVQIAYNDATTFERADPFLQMLASDVGFTDAQLDQLFTLAVTF
ncbi:MAG: hypothetical protein ACRYGK_19130 [Janthinobacterium lividum]